MVFKKKNGSSLFFQRTSNKKADKSTSSTSFVVAKIEAQEERQCVETRAERWGRLVLKTKDDTNARDDQHWVLPKDSFEVISGRFNHVKSSPKLASNTVRRSRSQRPTDTTGMSFGSTSSTRTITVTPITSNSSNTNTRTTDPKSVARTRAATPINTVSVTDKTVDDKNHVQFLEAIRETESLQTEQSNSIDEDDVKKTPASLNKNSRNNGNYINSNLIFFSDTFQCNSCKIMW